MGREHDRAGDNRGDAERDDRARLPAERREHRQTERERHQAQRDSVNTRQVQRIASTTIEPSWTRVRLS